MKEHFGYSEPLRRFIQLESFEPQANEIPNTMPSWLPGDDYMTNFKVGDPYVRIDDGYARLPGAGYEALHPELKGVNPEDYPDINKLSILSDVAPYSREYNLYRQKVASQARNSTELQIELDKIVDRVRQTKESSVVMDNQVSPSCRTPKTSRARAGKLARFVSTFVSADEDWHVAGGASSSRPTTKALTRARLDSAVGTFLPLPDLRRSPVSQSGTALLRHRFSPLSRTFSSCQFWAGETYFPT
jgi:hypothetical protein